VNGSSGDRHTESLSLSFLSFFTRYIDIDTKTGEISTLMSGYWDEETESGSRDGSQSLPTLGLLCRRTVANNFHLYDKKDLVMLIKMKLFTREEITVDLTSAYVPIRGRRLNVADEKDQIHYKEINVKTLTVVGLKKAIATKFKVAETALDKVYSASIHKRLIEIEEDSQVEDLLDDMFIVASFK
jgi:HSP20 family molecular chaperone IbpA